MNYKIIIFGVQGAGKGTQAEKIVNEFGVCHISPGEIFRREISKQTDLGKEAESYIKEGKLVPDKVTNKVVAKRIKEPDCLGDGYVLDGYPRNIAQAGFLDSIDEMTHVFNIKISDEEAVERISSRRICPRCGEIFNLKFKPPREPGVCDICGAELIQREDDSPEAVKERLKIYHTETEPLLDFYCAKDKLYEIDGERSIEDVWADIKKVLEK